MTTNVEQPTATSVLSSSELLAHWQGHRSLTRKMIEAFPEKEMFEYSLGGMRTFANLVAELLAIAAPGIQQIATGETPQLDEAIDFEKSKAKMLELWDESTDLINQYWAELTDDKFAAEILSFGQFPGTGLSSILYFTDNEIHHRGQAYVYLRTLNVEPPAFWDR